MIRYKNISGILILAACSIGCAGEKGENVATMAKLPDQLRVLIADKSLSYQKLLRDASHAVQAVAQDHLWSEIEPALKSQGLVQTRDNDSQHMHNYRYLLSKEGWKAGDGSIHDLFLEFSVDKVAPNANSVNKPTARAGLIIEPKISYAEMLKSKAYAEDSVLYRGLRLPEIAEAAKDYPILKKIDLKYDVIFDRWTETVTQGFHLEMLFSESATNDERSKYLYFSVPSGLDALRDLKSKVMEEKFQPKDTIGEFRNGGSATYGGK